MIRRIRRKLSDDRMLAEFPGKTTTAAEAGCDFGDAIVKKPWGYEYLVFENKSVAIWLLHIARKQRTSMHAHLNKKTALVLLCGNANYCGLDKSVSLEPLDGLIIEKGAFHSTEAFSNLPIEPQSENGIWVMEIESPVEKADLVRIKDEYGRRGVAYEGVDQMVFAPKACLKLTEPKNSKINSHKFLNCCFKIMRGDLLKEADYRKQDILVSVIARRSRTAPDNPYLNIGDIFPARYFYEHTCAEDLSDYTLLLIERQNVMIKLSDYIFSSIAALGIKEVFAVCGGGAMHLVDSLGKNEDLKYIATHHEQAASMAAEAHARISGKPGVTLVTSGPGGTNTLTGVFGAWIDSIPVIFISGQVTTDTLIKDTGLRQFGIQEADIIKVVKPITKYAVTVTDPFLIRYHLEKALYLATTGRPGPVWLDIPLDIQSRMINLEELSPFKPEEVKNKDKHEMLKKQVSQSITLLKNAKRPVIICGYGIRLSRAEEEFLRLVERLKIPVISSWTASDLIPSSHKYYVGRGGIMGDRAGNFTVQNSDLLLIIGSRMSIPQVGYNYKTFAREAKKIMVDIDPLESKKPSIKIDLSVNADAREFIAEVLLQLDNEKTVFNDSEWLERTQDWKDRYPVVLPEYREAKEHVNSFYFIDVLSEKLGSDAIVVTDMGTSFTCTMQTFKVKKGQRLFTSSGHASMGFGLPGAIGACFANGKKKTICVSGDGGLQMNIQELQTLIHYDLPIILFVLNNRGYLTIKLMQQNHFGRYVGSEKDSGLSCPDIIKVAGAYGIKSERISDNSQLHDRIDNILAQRGPFICEIMMPENQPLIPRVSSLKKPDETIISKPLEDMYPFLSRKEFLENMIVNPIEVLRG